MAVTVTHGSYDFYTTTTFDTATYFDSNNQRELEVYGGGDILIAVFGTDRWISAVVEPEQEKAS